MIQATTSFFSSFFILCCGYNYGCVHIVINIGDFDIGKFSVKLPIVNINSLPIIVLYGITFLLALC